MSSHVGAVRQVCETETPNSLILRTVTTARPDVPNLRTYTRVLKWARTGSNQGLRPPSAPSSLGDAVVWVVGSRRIGTERAQRARSAAE